MSYWLVCNGGGPPDALVVELAGLGRSLPVFSFREEAELFLALGGLGENWRAMRGATEDFLSLFFGPEPAVRNVVLDPLPAMLRDGTAGLISLTPERFADRFLGISETEPDPGLTV